MPDFSMLDTRTRYLPLSDCVSSLPVPKVPKGPPTDGPLVTLPAMPSDFKREFITVVKNWQDGLMDHALSYMQADLKKDSRINAKGKQREVVLTPLQKDCMGRLAYSFVPNDTWQLHLPFYVGALQFVLNAHGPLGLRLVEDAAFFLRLPMPQVERVRNLFSIGFVPSEAVLGMRPLMQLCVEHDIEGSGLVEIFERLSVCKEPRSLAQRMVKAAKAPGEEILKHLEPRILELWLYIATEMPHTHDGDASWASFAGKAMLKHLTAQRASGVADAKASDIDMALLRETLEFSPVHRAAMLDLMLPLLRTGRLRYCFVAGVLQLFATHGPAARSLALELLTREAFRAESAEHLLTGVLSASRQAFHSIKARTESKV